METEKYVRSMHTSLGFVKAAVAALADFGLLDNRQRDLAETDSFVACTADAAENLAKAIMARHGIDAYRSHAMEDLARQARKAGHDDLAEGFLQMNGRTRNDHAARYEGADSNCVGCAIARLPVFLIVMRKELASIPEEFLNAKHVDELAVAAVATFARGAESLRDAIKRDGAGSQPSDPCGRNVPMIRFPHALASKLDDTAEGMRNDRKGSGKDE